MERPSPAGFLVAAGLPTHCWGQHTAPMAHGRDGHGLVYVLGLLVAAGALESPAAGL